MTDRQGAFTDEELKRIEAILGVNARGEDIYGVIRAAVDKEVSDE